LPQRHFKIIARALKKHSLSVKGFPVFAPLSKETMDLELFM